MSSEWTMAETHKAEELAQVSFYSMKKVQDGREIEFLITVKEYASPKDASMRFFAQADKQTNQNTAPMTPSGWGSTLLKALADCIQSIRRFPYEGPP
jgi:hypothetical protein